MFDTYPSINSLTHDWYTVSCCELVSKTWSNVNALSFPSQTWGSFGVTLVHTVHMSINSLGTWGRILLANRWMRKGEQARGKWKHTERPLRYCLIPLWWQSQTKHSWDRWNGGEVRRWWWPESKKSVAKWSAVTISWQGIHWNKIKEKEMVREEDPWLLWRINETREREAKREGEEERRKHTPHTSRLFNWLRAVDAYFFKKSLTPSGYSSNY